MSLNREKVALGLVVLLFAVGAYGVAVGFLSPSQEVRIPDTSIAQVESRPFLPEPRVFRAERPASRNPFRLAEGWQQLDALPLAPPPVPAGERLRVGLTATIPAERAGFVFEDRHPAETEESRSAASEPGGAE